MRKTDADFYPLIQLKHGGFTHRDSRVGWVNTPVLAVVGRIPRTDAAKPDGKVERPAERHAAVLRKCRRLSVLLLAPSHP